MSERSFPESEFIEFLAMLSQMDVEATLDTPFGVVTKRGPFFALKSGEIKRPPDYLIS